MSYILIVDDEEDIREMLRMCLSISYSLEIATSFSGNDALRIIKEKGNPEIIISDYRMADGDGAFLYKTLKSMKSDIPFVVCSGNPIDELRNVIPSAYGYIEKPRILGGITQLINSVLNRYKTNPEYISISISFLLRQGHLPFDLYIKIGNEKIVKVYNQGESFQFEDKSRFEAKNLQYLYILKNDAEKFLKYFEEGLKLIMDTEMCSPSSLMLSMDSLEIVGKLGSVLGWSQEMIDLAHQSVKIAIKALSKNSEIMSLLNQRFQNSSSDFYKHATLLSMISSLFCHHLGWAGETTQVKMAMAGLLHDITIDENLYKDIEVWNESARSDRDKSELVNKYRNHPIDAVGVLRSIPNFPPDVDQIILQHHERKDGSGFPRKLSGSRISPLATLFILSEDLVNFIFDGENIESRIVEFFNERESYYNSGNFKKVFSGIREKIVLRPLN